MNKVLKNAQEYLLSESLNNWDYKKDGASLLSSLLFEEATDIHFFVGRAINPAHQNPSLPHLKTKVVEELCECLIKMGKRVTIRFF